MKKKIGFIDYFIDEWHANKYPELIRNSVFGSHYEVTHAWAKIDPDGKKPLRLWCEEQQVSAAQTLEQVVEACDCLIVLSPDNPEYHIELADQALRSGKPIYIDKPFAPTRKEAELMQRIAREHRTPLMSCSALRYDSQFRDILGNQIGGKPVQYVMTRAAGRFSVYAIHQLELLVMSLGVGAERVLRSKRGECDLMLIDYPDGRRGQLNLIPGNPYEITIAYGDNQLAAVREMTGFFPLFIEAMLNFFETGVSPIPEEQTLEIITLLEAGNRAAQFPDQWLTIMR